jgi:CRP/FNR family cyclic AMP-dependent transcriptional regulator
VYARRREARVQAEAILAAAVGAEGAAALMPHLERVPLAAGDVLFTEGAPSPWLWVVVEGEVAVRAGQVELVRRGPGSWLGEVGFLDKGPAMATVVAATSGAALRIGHDTLVRLGSDHPAAASALLRHLTRQLATRIAEGSAGIAEEVSAGEYRLRKPEEVQGWLGRALEQLFGWGGAR